MSDRGKGLWLTSDLLLVGQSRVDKLAVEDAGALGVRGQEPDDKGDLQLKVKRKPGQQEHRITPSVGATCKT